MVMYDSEFKTHTKKFKPRITLNHNTYTIYNIARYSVPELSYGYLFSFFLDFSSSRHFGSEILNIKTWQTLLVGKHIRFLPWLSLPYLFFPTPQNARSCKILKFALQPSWPPQQSCTLKGSVAKFYNFLLHDNGMIVWREELRKNFLSSEMGIEPKTFRTRYFTLIVPLSAQVYKWVPANFLLG